MNWFGIDSLTSLDGCLLIQNKMEAIMTMSRYYLVEIRNSWARL